MKTGSDVSPFATRPAPDAALTELTRINTADMLESFGLQHVRRGRSLLELACRWPARRFARTVLEFDRRVGELGLAAAAAWGMARFAARLHVVGGEQIPRQGPVLFLANHPGITDTLALFAALQRSDLRTIAAARPFLANLAHTTQQLIFVDPDSGSQLAVVRAASRHLRRGGAVLTFPAGRIEPDPAVLPGAATALDNWSPSIDLLARLAPETQVTPVLVSGVFSPRAAASPLVRLRRSQEDRERFAAMLQIVAPARFPVTVTVQVGAALPPGSGKTAAVSAMRELLTQSPIANLQPPIPAPPMD